MADAPLDWHETGAGLLREFIATAHRLAGDAASCRPLQLQLAAGGARLLRAGLLAYAEPRYPMRPSEFCLCLHPARVSRTGLDWVGSGVRRNCEGRKVRYASSRRGVCFGFWFFFPSQLRNGLYRLALT